MHFKSQTQVVLLAVLAVCVQMCVGAGAGEDGGMCKGPLRIPIPLTVCQAECPVVGNLPGVTWMRRISLVRVGRPTLWPRVQEGGVQRDMSTPSVVRSYRDEIFEQYREENRTTEFSGALERYIAIGHGGGPSVASSGRKRGAMTSHGADCGERDTDKSAEQDRALW
ncbi:hypothetical protein DFH08DRAFT_930345 [Mycena albidolilacea]|uniref:Uncharacterized protein n=1 Tax=Mycena albidolilacea TaxID=1033008 RepID=A0AAD7APJ5_9AGAR|nr:hypothetical protein DFH08DRAFT_930345 [Mycena albidolilacea]